MTVGAKPVKVYPSYRPRPDHSSRRWHVEYDLAYDGGGSTWIGCYRSLVGARLAVWWNRHVASWGGSAEIFDTEPAVVSVPTQERETRCP